MVGEYREIPKVIHYCWFGGNPLPDDAKRCIESWRKYCPGFEVKQWNENNFDLTSCDYVNEAYKAKKWAFVSDYARFWILYNYGGLYFDTDVELIKPIDNIIADGPFMGREATQYDSYKRKIEQQIFNQLCSLKILNKEKSVHTEPVVQQYALNPGLGVGAYPHMKFYRQLLDLYKTQHFVLTDKTFSPITVVDYTTTLAKGYGVQGSINVQQALNVDGEKINIYPTDIFCPMNYDTGKITLTPNTVSIHHYSASWLTSAQKAERVIKKFSANHGLNYRIERALTLPIRVVGKVQSLGVRETFKLIVHKFNK